MIVFPMAGDSRRFREAGFGVPKYMLEAHGRSLFAHAVGGFGAYVDALPMLFILRDVAGSEAFVRAEVARLGIRRPRFAVLDAPTAGQAATVAAGLERAGVCADEPLTIFNIDTFRPGFRFPDGFDVAKVDGFLETFRGGGSNWSYVKPVEGSADRVAATTEKVPVSDLCCTGLYHFRAASLFRDAFAEFQAGEAAAMGLSELYVAPMYNLLIRRGLDVRFSVIPAEDVIFCGVPAEYESFLADPPPAG